MGIVGPAVSGYANAAKFTELDTKILVGTMYLLKTSSYRRDAAHYNGHVHVNTPSAAPGRSDDMTIQ